MKPKRFFFVLLGIISFIVVGGGIGYYLASRNLESGTTRLRQKLAAVELAEAKTEQLAALKRSYQNLQFLIPRLEVALPQAKKQSEVVLQLQQVATATGMSLPSVTFNNSSGLPSPTSQTEKAGEALALPVNFVLNGSYEQMKAFLQQIEQIGRYSVTSLAISKTDKPKSLTFTTTVSAYIKP